MRTRKVKRNKRRTRRGGSTKRNVNGVNKNEFKCACREQNIMFIQQAIEHYRNFGVYRNMGLTQQIIDMFEDLKYDPEYCNICEDIYTNLSKIDALSFYIELGDALYSDNSVDLFFNHQEQYKENLKKVLDKYRITPESFVQALERIQMATHNKPIRNSTNNKSLSKRRRPN